MRASELLRSIDGLSYGQRVRFLADRARELTGLLAELGRGDAFERTLGIQIAEVARETSYITRVLHDPEPAVRTRALAAVARGVPVSDDDLRILYDDAPAALRSKLVSLVRRTRREHLATRLIDEHRARWGDVAATGLLEATDRATFARLLPDLAYCVTPGGWRRLAKHHPAEVVDFATRTLPTGEDRDEWWQGVGHGVTAALGHDPDAVLALIKQAIPAHDLSVAVLDIIGPLADRDPAGVLELVLAPDRRAVVPQALTPAFRRRLHRYSDEELIALGRILWPDLTGLLHDLAPSRRATIFEAVTGSVDLSQAVLSEELLDVLPRTTRHEQARRMIALPVVTENTLYRWRVLAQLPYEEAFAELESEVRRPDENHRAGVYRAVLRAAGRSRRPSVLADALRWAAERVRNDRDHVRSTVLFALTAIPPSLLGDEHVDQLETLLTDALNARDTSWATRRALTKLAERGVVQGALGNRPGLLDWGLQAHARLTENGGSINLYGLIDGLPRGREVDVYDVLRPSIEAAAKRNEFGLAFAVAAALGRRAWSLDQLQDVLEQAVWSNQENTVQQACRYWLDAPWTRLDRCQRIIDRDVRMARWHPVWWVVTEFRTDLLDPVFAAADQIRRFDRNSPAWEVPDYAIRLWLPRQQARYAELLVGAARDARMPQWYRASAVKMLGHVPGAALDQFLRSDDVLLQEAALSGLAWTNRPDVALPLLLAHASDDRARVAMYAASRAARYVRPSLLPGLLQPVLAGLGAKITSRKEAVRLLGELRAPGAGAVLTEAWPSAHRDVRAAIASTVSQYLLYDPAAWAVLEQAVHDSAATAVVLTERRAYAVPVVYRSRYADLLIAVTTRTEPEVVGHALAALQGWARHNRAAARVCADFIIDLTRRNGLWGTAVASLVGIVATNPDDGLDELVDVVRLLVRLESDPDLPNAAADRDHPARQRLSYLVKQLTEQLSGRSAKVRQLLKQVAAELTGPDFLHLHLQLLVTSLQGSQLAEELAAVRRTVVDNPIAAHFAADLLRHRLTATESTWTPSSLLEVTTNLVHSDDLTSGLFAHTLLATAAPRAGWASEWRTLLQTLRTHPSPPIRHQALDLTTSPET
ncbi:hypothetical protein AB0F43_04100 [Kribbella sp. NPDC023972]|uniref:hypothetical protein n=1 Tax=Kribbella sp. NPDC023972 TaxID=3154795 RepID=UPI003405676D